MQATIPYTELPEFTPSESMGKQIIPLIMGTAYESIWFLFAGSIRGYSEEWQNENHI